MDVRLTGRAGFFGGGVAAACRPAELTGIITAESAVKGLVKLHLNPSKRWVLAAMLLTSTGLTFWGRGPAMRLRKVPHYLLSALGQPAMAITTKLKTGDRQTGITAEQARRLREEKDYFRAMAAYWRRRSEISQRHVRNLASFRRLYGPTSDLPVELIPARVVWADPLPYGKSRVVHLGRSGKAAAGLPVAKIITGRSKALPERLAVVTASALVGRLAETGAQTARLQLITDRHFRIRARIRRDIDLRRPRTISTRDGRAEVVLTAANNYPIDTEAAGDGAGGLIVREIKARCNVRIGDWLYTRDDDALLPAEVRIGRVAQVLRAAKNPQFVRLLVRPLVDLATLREVYVVAPVVAKPSRAARNVRRQ